MISETISLSCRRIESKCIYETMFQNAVFLYALDVTTSQNAYKLFTFYDIIVIVALSKGIA